MKRKGDGSIFSLRTGAQFTPLELLETIATGDASSWCIDADDPASFLRHIERTPLAIVRDHEERNPHKLSWVEGAGACHLYGMPADPPPVFADAIEMVTQLGKLFRRVESSWQSNGGLIAISVQVGFLLAMLHSRNHEYFAYLGQINDKNLASNRQGKPITAKAMKLFLSGDSVREVAAKCKVGYQVARRWKKLSENR